MIAQERAINSGLEKISIELLTQVAKDAFGTARRVLQQLANPNENDKNLVEDLFFDFSAARENKSTEQNRTQTKPSKKSLTTRITTNVNSATPPESMDSRIQATLSLDSLPLGYQALKARNFIRDCEEILGVV